MIKGFSNSNPISRKYSSNIQLQWNRHENSNFQLNRPLFITNLTFNIIILEEIFLAYIVILTKIFRISETQIQEISHLKKILAGASFYKSECTSTKHEFVVLQCDRQSCISYVKNTGISNYIPLHLIQAKFTKSSQRIKSQEENFRQVNQLKSVCIMEYRAITKP